MGHVKTFKYFIFAVIGVTSFFLYINLMVDSVWAQEKYELVFWHGKGGDRGKDIQKMIDEFNKTHPNIQVKGHYQGGYTDTLRKITTAIAADATPDVCEIPHRYGIPQFSESGKLVALNPLISEGEIKDFFEGPIQRFMYKGKLWGLPNAISTNLLIYNANMFKEVGLDPNKPPDTWDELVTCAKKLTRDIDKDGRIDKWGLVFHTTTNYFIYSFIFQNGGKIFDQDGNPVFNDERGVEACQFWADLVHKHKVVPPLTHQAANKLFMSGTAAMIYQSTGQLEDLEKGAGGRFEVKVAFMPKKKQYGTSLGGTGIGMFKSDPKREAAAWEFVKWMTDTKRSAFWAENTGYIAPRKSTQALASHRSFLESHPAYNVAAKQMPYASIWPASKADGIIYGPFSKLAEKMEADPNVNVKKVLDEIAEKARKEGK